MTDPKRTPSPVKTVLALPEKTVIIYRHFGADDREIVAAQLREVTHGKTQQLLIGADPELAKQVRADGVHFTRDATLKQPHIWREKRPDWLITMAGLKGIQDYKGKLSVLDGLFISSVFPSKSPSAGEPVGVESLTRLQAELGVPIFALGGITAETAPSLIGSGISGLAAIDGILKDIVMMNIEAQDTDYGHRFVYREDGHDDAELTMKRIDDDLFNANHTGVPKSMGGRGIGKALIEFMSNHAREHGYRVIPGCPFVAAMWKRRPDWAEGISA